MEDKDMSMLGEVPTRDNDLKNYIVEYTGNKLQPENDEVTLEMVIDVLSQDFPELVLCLSEENWIRGYQQGLADVEEGDKILKQQYEELHKK